MYIEKQAVRPGRPRLLSLAQALFQIVRQVAQRTLPGKASTALEGMQNAKNVRQRCSIVATRIPATKRRLHVLKQIIGLLDENIENFGFSSLWSILLRGLQRHAAGHTQLFGGAVAKSLDGFDQHIAFRQRLMSTHGLEHLCQSVLTGLQQPEQLGAGPIAAGTKPFVQVFKFVRQVADLTDIGHPSAALEGVQVAL